MNPPTDPPSYGIGACLNCRHVYLLTPTQRDCPLCMGPPKLWAPFHGVETPPYRAAEPEPPPVTEQAGPAFVDVLCPGCGQPLRFEEAGQDVVLKFAPGTEPAAAAAAATPEGQVAEEAPGSWGACVHGKAFGDWCEECYQQETPETLDGMGRTVEAAQKRLAAEAAEPSDRSPSERDLQVGVADDGPVGQMPDDVAETQPAEEPERVPASDNDAP